MGSICNCLGTLILTMFTFSLTSLRAVVGVVCSVIVKIGTIFYMCIAFRIVTTGNVVVVE